MISHRLACTVVIAHLLSTAPAWADFTNVINSPPDAIVPSAVIGNNTQLNLYPGAAANLGDVLQLGDFNAPVQNAQLNVLGGSAWAVEAWTGSELNVVAGSIKTANLLGSCGTMSGGAVDNWALFAKSHLEMSGGFAARVETAGTTDGPSPKSASFTITGGQVGILDSTGNATIQGGTIDNFFFRGGGSVEISGGSIGDDFEVGSVVTGALVNDPAREVVVGSGGQVTVTGGSIGKRMILRDGRTLNYSGGTIGDAFQALDGSQVNIHAAHFTIDGVEQSWPTNEPFIITQRNVTLTGLLASGQPFHFMLNSELGYGDYFSPAATLTIIPTPEPTSTALFVIGLTLAILSGHRLRRRIR